RSASARTMARRTGWASAFSLSAAASSLPEVIAPLPRGARRWRGPTAPPIVYRRSTMNATPGLADDWPRSSDGSGPRLRTVPVEITSGNHEDLSGIDPVRIADLVPVGGEDGWI